MPVSFAESSRVNWGHEVDNGGPMRLTTDLLHGGGSGPVWVGSCPGAVGEGAGEPGHQGHHLDQENCLVIHRRMSVRDYS